MLKKQALKTTSFCKLNNLIIQNYEKAIARLFSSIYTVNAIQIFLFTIFENILRFY